MKINIWTPPLTLIFFIGGPLQLLNIITPTTTNIIVILSLIAALLYKKLKLSELKQEWLIGVFFIYIILLQFIHPTTLQSFAVYTYYIICVLVGSISGRIFANRYNSGYPEKSYAKLANSFLLIQAIATTIQNIFAAEISSYSIRNIGSLDAVSGTLFLQSDATLAIICILICISLFFTQQNIKYRLLAATLTFIVIFNGNSIAAKFCVIIATLLLALHYILKTSNRNTPFISVLIYGAFFTTTIITLLNLPTLTTPIIQEINNGFYNRYSQESAHRLAPLGHIFLEDLSLFGNGLLTYYNPITKDWLYNSGFSTLYSSYIDTGIFGTIILYAYFTKKILSKNISKSASLLMLICIAAFSAFNFAMSDLAFIFALSFTSEIIRTSSIFQK